MEVEGCGNTGRGVTLRNHRPRRHERGNPRELVPDRKEPNKVARRKGKELGNL
ncbi:MAG: hypothetical protein YYHSYBAR_003412 [Candidatus Fervidibacter sacchari]